METPEPSDRPDKQFRWNSSRGEGTSGPAPFVVSPRVNEAFGGRENVAHSVRTLVQEFMRTDDLSKERCAIVGSAGLGNNAFRVWTDNATESSIVTPFPEIAALLCNDQEAYGYGWVFAHTHSLKRTPSKQDDSTTCCLAWIGKLLDCPLVDHWIFTLDDPGFFSYSNTKPEFLTPSVNFEVGEDY